MGSTPEAGIVSASNFSAGVGRTGTLMAARFLLDRLRKNPQKVDIIGTVLAMRKWRKSLVQGPVGYFSPFSVLLQLCFHSLTLFPLLSLLVTIAISLQLHCLLSCQRESWHENGPTTSDSV